MEIIEKYQVLLLMKKQFIGDPQCSNGSPYYLKEHENNLWILHVFVYNIIETLWCYKWTLLNSLEIFLVKLKFSGKSQCFYGSPYGVKEHKNDEMFCPHYF